MMFRIGRQPILFWFTLFFIAAIVLVPYAWVLSSSLKKRLDILSIPPSWFKDPSLFNYFNMLFERRFSEYLMNSIIIGLRRNRP